MTVAELESKVDLLALIEQKYKIKKAGSNTYRVEPCPVCGHKEHFTIYPETNSYVSFNGCCNGGSVYKYLQEVEGMSEEEALEELKRLAGEPIEYKNSATHQPKAERGAPKQTSKQDYTKWITELYHRQTTEDRLYFINRGIPDKLIEKYKLCVANIGDGQRAILPVWQDGKAIYYTGRALEDQEPRYKNATGPAPIFNIEYLKHAQNGEAILICEGIFDALSAEAAGFKAIALGGVKHVEKLKTAIEEMPADKEFLFLTALDNDEEGQKTATELPYRTIKIPSKYKDLNEWYISEPEAFRTNIAGQIEAAKKPDTVSEYLNKAFVTDVEKFRTYIDKKTGFSNLDKEMGGLYAGLYIVGGISSVGKTTFIQQLGDQIAEQGEHVIFFSLEQSKLELVSKSLARLTAKMDYKNAVPAIRIRSGYIPEQVIKAAEVYEKTATRISIIEGNYNTTVTSIREYIKHYISMNRVKPIVIIDYLQVIPGDIHLSDKQRIDSTVTELKRISRDFDITVFAISSLNRGNYLAPIDFESFKESGGIEYTADVIWGLQLAAINEEIFNKEGKLKEKRERIRQAKAEDPRKIELVCLKNKSGKPFFSCLFSYYPKYDLFIPEE